MFVTVPGRVLCMYGVEMSGVGEGGESGAQTSALPLRRQFRDATVACLPLSLSLSPPFYRRPPTARDPGTGTATGAARVSLGNDQNPSSVLVKRKTSWPLGPLASTYRAGMGVSVCVSNVPLACQTAAVGVFPYCLLRSKNLEICFYQCPREGMAPQENPYSMVQVRPQFDERTERQKVTIGGRAGGEGNG